jgi:hypothetical protein
MTGRPASAIARICMAKVAGMIEVGPPASDTE